MGVLEGLCECLNCSEQQIDALGIVTNHAWFYWLDLIGTAAFAISGIRLAFRKHYDAFGALVLAFLPAVGGGTVRDILVNRFPLFYFKDHAYMLIIFGVWVTGLIVAYFHGRMAETTKTPHRFSKASAILLELTDAIGVGAFCIIGARVALISGLAWFWAPILAALTCAGGGILRDVLTNEEPGVLKGEIYEEIAVFGAILFLIGLKLINCMDLGPLSIEVLTIVTIAIIIAARMLIYFKNLRFPTLR